MNPPTESAEAVTAFAPATVANVAVGFDILGFALRGVGDHVTVATDPAGDDVTIEAIRGVVPDLPTDPGKNTASVALRALLAAHRPDHGFRISLHKGIPLGSGMGGSAASAVAAVVAADRLLGGRLSTEEMLRYAAAGEQVSSGSPHVDNVAPALCGGLTALVASDPPRVVRLPLPDGLVSVLVHPHVAVETRGARAALPAELPLARHVEQSMRLCGFLAGCYRDDLELIGRSMADLVAEPTRARAIPGFERAREAAIRNGALALAIAGSGPSVFAWATSPEVARAVEQAILRVFEEQGVGADGWTGPIAKRGAAVVEGPP